MADDKSGVDDLPEPEATGVTPDQVAASPADTEAALVRLVAPPPGAPSLAITSVSGAVVSLRGFGAGVQMLLGVTTHQMETELAATRQERDELRKMSEDWKDKYTQEREHVAVLKQALTVQRLKSVLITVGGIMAAIQFPNWWNAFGVLLLLLGWLWPGPKD